MRSMSGIGLVTLVSLGLSGPGCGKKEADGPVAAAVGAQVPETPKAKDSAPEAPGKAQVPEPEAPAKAKDPNPEVPTKAKDPEPEAPKAEDPEPEEPNAEDLEREPNEPEPSDEDDEPGEHPPLEEDADGPSARPEPGADGLACELVSFGRRKQKAVFYKSITELVTKKGFMDGAPDSEQEARSLLRTRLVDGDPDDSKANLLIHCEDYGPTDNWPMTCLLVPGKGGYWLAREIAFPQDEPSCLPDGFAFSGATFFEARLSKDGGHAVVPYFHCDVDRFIERRNYYTWVDPESGWQVRFVTRDEGKDLARIGEALMEAGYWEVCSQLLKTDDPSKVGTVRLEAAREQIQRSQEEPW